MCVLLVSPFLILAATSLAQADREVPGEILSPSDPIMAAPSDLEEVLDWAGSAFVGEEAPSRGPKVHLEARRQDYNVLRFGRSCMETPIRIGTVGFQHGLGTHAVSEIAVKLPAGSRRFQASVGVDANDDTQGRHGSVRFSLEIDGREVLRTPTLKGGDAPKALDVEIPAGSREMILKVDTTEDGPAYDQADWADARIVLEDGSALRLDQNQSDPFFLPDPLPPFSFIYGGRPSREILKGWRRTVERKDLEDRVEVRVLLEDAATGLQVTALVTAFQRYPAVEWVLRFENRGDRDTPILEKVQALDLRVRTGNSRRPAVLHQIAGDTCDERSFLPLQTVLVSGRSLRLAPSGGRSSNGTFPFFSLQYGDEGVIAAIGWSGQWAATLDRSAAGPTRIQAGMEETGLVLHPGETIRSPRILLLSWKGDRIAAQNRFRRLLLFKYAPRDGERPVRLPVVSQCFDRYSVSRPEWATEAGQIAAARSASEVGFDTHWLDAAWFPGGFPNGVGNWSAKPKEFPRGLKPVADFCHERKMRFVLWFEPERVAAGSEIAREHPEFVFGGEKGGLFKLNEPGARRWLTDLLSRRIEEYGIDIYRNDFNIDPLGFWRANDPPDRRGMTEIRYIEGLYEMWDELRARRPGLLIDNCASGGRRIDLETCMRSVPFWRSDTSCGPGHPDWNQVQSYGLSLYIPLHMACGWTPQAYDFRSSATAGAIAQWDYLDPGFPRDVARACLAETKENCKYWYGDFYPLTDASLAPDAWMAYQLHRQDLDAGLVLVFRHKESSYTGLAVSLRALDPRKDYRVETIDDGRRSSTKTMAGRDLMTEMELKLPRKESSLLLRYTPSKG